MNKFKFSKKTLRLDKTLFVLHEIICFVGIFLMNCDSN